MCGSAVSRPVGGGGRAGLVAVSERKSYKTDLSDEQWALVEPVITAWKAAHPSVSGHQGRYTMREIVNAVVVTAASAHENAVGITLLDKVAADTDTVKKALVDQGFKNTVVAHGETPD